KGDLSGWWSVRIDDANRIVFRIDGEVLTIYSCAGHYED
ncbi:MAG: type II toxin-antitoxin system YoeB family toxin, partial [Fibrobacterales bacterium]|nr:type II toxin-antitoxin system YoeB family toxin [Fibrobacterales bacterium]